MFGTGTTDRRNTYRVSERNYALATTQRYIYYTLHDRDGGEPQKLLNASAAVEIAAEMASKLGSRGGNWCLQASATYAAGALAG